MDFSPRRTRGGVFGMKQRTELQTLDPETIGNRKRKKELERLCRSFRDEPCIPNLKEIPVIFWCDPSLGATNYPSLVPIPVSKISLLSRNHTQTSRGSHGRGSLTSTNWYPFHVKWMNNSSVTLLLRIYLTWRRQHRHYYFSFQLLISFCVSER